MAYSYSSWATQTTAADQLTYLNLHIAEVTAQMGPDMSSAAGSVGRSALSNYLNLLYGERRRLEVKTNNANSGFTRGRAV